MYNKKRIELIVKGWVKKKTGLELSDDAISKMVDDITETQIQSLHIHGDSGRSEQFVCRDCEKKTQEYKDNLYEPCHKWHTN